ncbi:MAG TPA: response regulator [Phycisphaerae bacterium]|nr:response regulator [Phycisphaerae bacterium]
MSRLRDVLTTGEVAAICKVAPRTVSKWFDSGRLKGYRIPGSKDRRIPLDQLIRFMKAHNIPLNGLESGGMRVLIAESDSDMADLLSVALQKEAGYEVQVARSAFEAGATAGVFHPHVMLFDSNLAGLHSRDTIRAIRNMPDVSAAKLIAITSDRRDGEIETLKQQGFDAALAKPFDVTQIVQTIESVISSNSN